MNEDSIATIFEIIILSTLFFSLVISILTLIGQWKAFVKAGKPGWAALIPIYNNIVMLEIAELPNWYLVLYFIPFANIYVQVITYLELVKKYGESTGFAIGLLFLPYVFWPMLGLGKTKYVGSNNKFCPDCGTKLDGNANFCMKCGHKFN